MKAQHLRVAFRHGSARTSIAYRVASAKPISRRLKLARECRLRSSTRPKPAYNAHAIG